MTSYYKEAFGFQFAAPSSLSCFLSLASTSMDPLPPQSPSLPPTSSATTAKLRLMCSYGGHIVPRPRTKSLCYAGGDTRIVAIDRRTITTLASLVTHLSSALSLNYSFTLKYQLPHLDLDSLILISSDDDFYILIDEYDRLASSPSPTPPRIRVFLFPTKLDSGCTIIHHPKTEAWFFDALKSAKIMQKGRHCLMGMEGEDHGYCSGAEPRTGGELSHSFFSCGPESMILETSSSFGSTSSSASLSNLPPIKAQGEDNDANLQDSKVKFTPSDTIPSDNAVSSFMSHEQNISYPFVHASSKETIVNADSIEFQSKTPGTSSGIIAINNVSSDVGYHSFPQLNQVQMQHVQFVQPGSHLLPLNPSGPLPVASYFYQNMYQQAQPLQHVVCHPNQPYPYAVYLMPIGHMPRNNLPMQCGLTNTTSASSQTSMQANASFMASHVAHNSEGGTTYPFTPDIASQSHKTANAETSFVHVPYNGSQQQEMDFPPMYHQSQTFAITSGESFKLGNELDDDLARVQIYKSQPPPPSLSSQYQIMTKATRVLVSEALPQLHVDSLTQRTETSQPQ